MKTPPPIPAAELATAPRPAVDARISWTRDQMAELRELEPALYRALPGLPGLDADGNRLFPKASGAWNLDGLRERLDHADATAPAAARAGRLLARYDELDAEYQELCATVWERGGGAGTWTRYYRSTTPAGGELLHSWERGHACRRTVWATELSGTPLEEVVAARGPVLCAACWPDVRAEWLAPVPVACTGGKKLGVHQFNAGTKGSCPVCGWTATLNQLGRVRKHPAQVPADA